LIAVGILGRIVVSLIELCKDRQSKKTTNLIIPREISKKCSATDSVFSSRYITQQIIHRIIHLLHGSGRYVKAQ
jgi:hypothetical protein